MEKDMDPKRATSNIQEFIVENERIRVLEVYFKPGQKAIIHHHSNQVVYIARGGKAKLTSEGQSNILELKTGQTIFLDEQDHEAENIGNTDLELLVVELEMGNTLNSK
jgi:beta-alanine degradation protein BauB